MNTLLVQAVRYGTTIPDANTPTSYEYKENEIGVVEWRWHPTDTTFLEPVVCWDSDPTRKERRFLFNDVLILGVQNGNLRVTVDSKSA